MASQLSSSYLDNKLKSLRGGGAPVSGATIRSTSPGVAARYPTFDTVSTNLSFTGARTTFQPSFVNKDNYFPVQIGGNSSPRRSPVLGSNYVSESRPIGTYTRERSYEPIRPSSPLRSIPKQTYGDVPSKTYELKANPEIYSLTGFNGPTVTTTGSYSSNAPIPYTSSFSLGDIQRLISPVEEANIMNNMRNELLKLDVDHFQSGTLNATPEEIRSLKERVPMERQTTARLEKNMVDQLLEDDSKRQLLTQKITELDSRMRQVGADSSVLEKELRQVQFCNQVESERQKFADENRRLVDELKVFGKRANETIADLDSKMNGIKRMHGHEKDNFDYELQNIKSQFQYILSEMDSDFKAKCLKAEQELAQINSRKEE